MHTVSRFPEKTVIACQALTGHHPADLVGVVAECTAALTELEHLFWAIADASQGACTCSNPALALARIHGLAGEGQRVAADVANYADCGREALQTALSAPAEEVAA